MKKVSYRSQKVGESENATNILSKLKAYLSLQSLPMVRRLIYSPRVDIFRNQPPCHTLYVISYGLSEAQLARRYNTTARQVAAAAICIPY